MHGTNNTLSPVNRRFSTRGLLLGVLLPLLAGLGIVTVVWATTPGDSWTTNANVLAAGVSSLQVAVFSDDLYYFGGLAANSKIYNSSDGETWGEVGSDSLPTSQLSDYSVVTVDASGSGSTNLILLGGVDSGGRIDEVFASSDAASWITHQDRLPAVVSGHCSVIFNGATWVLGGLDSGGSATTSVWSATNPTVASSWDDTYTGLPAARYQHACTVFQGRMWVIGGLDASGDPTSTVYSSFDGETWTLTSNVPVATANWNAVVYNNRIYAFGGVDGSATVLETVYSTLDGATWQEVGSSALLTGRSDYGSAVWQGRIWIVGGANSGNHDDVFYTDSLVGENPLSTPAPAFIDSSQTLASQNQSSDVSNSDLPGTWIFDPVLDMSNGWPLQFFLMMLAGASMIVAVVVASKVGRDHLFAPVIACVLVGLGWGIFGQGVLDGWQIGTVAVAGVITVLIVREPISS